MAKRAGQKEEMNIPVEHRIEDVAQFVVICRITTQEGNVGFVNLYAVNETEAFIKIIKAREVLENPNDNLEVIGTFQRCHLGVEVMKETTNG